MPLDNVNVRAGSSSVMRRTGGFALILASLLFIVVFAYLAAVFDYPAILDRPAAEVLPRLLATGATGRAVWSLYAFLPLLLLPAGLSAHAAFSRVAPGASGLAAVSAVVAALAMTLGLARWPSVHWRIAEAYIGGTEEHRVLLATAFDGLNLYLGRFIGEFLGELGLNLFFAACAYGLLRSPRVSPWIGWAGLAAAAAGGVAMFRNVTAVVAPIAEVNNLVLPIWMIVLGIALARRDVEAS